MTQPKFIITSEGYLRLGMVDMHKDLLQPGDHCLGGGYYEFDYISGRLLFSGRSYDYGAPQWSELEALRVPAAYEGLDIVWAPRPDSQLALRDILKIRYF